MKPELPSSIPKPEKIPSSLNRVEFEHSLLGAEQTSERLDGLSDRSISDIEVGNVASLTPLQLPKVSQYDAKNTTYNTNPLIAGDEDLIEKEWVDKAKKIINETKSDPYKQEVAIVGLRCDYKNKRYNGKRNVN
jgi:hypothetical protein